MHEATIAQRVIETIKSYVASGQIPGRVSRVFLRVGRLRAVLPDNLRFLFFVLSQETLLQGAGLEIEEVPVRGRCRGCGVEFDIRDMRFLCKKCGSPAVDIISGRELLIVAVDVE